MDRNLASFRQVEIELLLCCSRSCVSTDTADRIKTLLQKDIDWVYLMSAAKRHNVELLLYKSLNGTYSESVPRFILEQLRNSYHGNTLRSLFLAGQLLELLNLFEKYEIPAIPYKGIVLAASVYGSPEIRSSSDLDILVSPQDFSRAKEILLSHDFSYGEQPHLKPWEKPWEINFTSKDRNIDVDLHQLITPEFLNIRLNFDDLWKNLKLTSIYNKKVRSLAAEDLLLLLCIYLMRDFFLNRERLIQICDIAETIHVSQRINWGYLLEQAAKIGCTYILFLGILLARELFGANLPEEILQRLQAVQVVKLLAAQVRERLFSDTYQQTNPHFESTIFYCRTRERLQDLVPYLVHHTKILISPSLTERTLIPLPKQLYFLYYIIIDHSEYLSSMDYFFLNTY